MNSLAYCRDIALIQRRIKCESMPIAKIISEIVTQADQVPAATLIKRAITLDGHLKQEQILDAYTEAECHVINCILAKGCNLSAKGELSLAFRPHGKIITLSKADYNAQSEFLTLLGHVELSEQELCDYNKLRAAEKTALEIERGKMLSYLSLNGFDSVCGELLNLSEHMAPLIYYVGEKCISNFYQVGKSGFELEVTLREVLNSVMKERENSPIEFITLAYCMHLLARSGGYTRLEEQNSCQLSPERLGKFFEAKYNFYSNFSEVFVDRASFCLASLEKKAETLAHMRKIIEARHRFARHINGLNVRKKEIILPVAAIGANGSPGTSSPLANTIALLQRGLGADFSAQEIFFGDSFEQLLCEVSGPVGCAFASRFEALIDFVVREAVCATGSDFGMTRGTRDYKEFADAKSKDKPAIVCEWGQAHYFCHVVPSERIKDTYSSKTLSTILNAVSGRMRYNSWHYAPSYFEPNSIPAAREWFYAPRLADIADHSDHHHAGHVHATVRYSIRSPLPISIGEQMLPGFIDLRLMRQAGEPYSEADLVTAIIYTEALQFLYQKLMNFLIIDARKFEFKFGDKKWFAEAYPSSAGITIASLDLAQV